MVRAKFNVVSKKQTVDGVVIEMIPVMATNPENTSFFKWTPFGKLEMGTINPEAAAEFEVGKPYYIDFTKAE